MDTKELRDQLRGALGALDRFEQAVFQPASDLTVNQAVTKLAGAMRSFNIEFQLWSHRPGESEITWKVWDGHTHYKGSTLAAAVNAALDANRPEADAVAECDAALSAA